MSISFKKKKKCFCFLSHNSDLNLSPQPGVFLLQGIHLLISSLMEIHKLLLHPCLIFQDCSDVGHKRVDFSSSSNSCGNHTCKLRFLSQLTSLHKIPIGLMVGINCSCETERTLQSLFLLHKLFTTQYSSFKPFRPLPNGGVLAKDIPILKLVLGQRFWSNLD